MARFFTSPQDLADWVKEAGSADRATEMIINLPNVGTYNLLDIRETTSRIFSNRDVENASETLFKMLATSEITTLRLPKSELRRRKWQTTS